MISEESTAASASAQSNKKRLFFALWPDETVVLQIKQRVIKSLDACEGRILAAPNWHITLAYFGVADNEIQECMQQQAKTISATPFELELQITGFWPRPKVAWLAPQQTPPALEQLAEDLQQALVPCGYTPETRVYQPHITLVRKAVQPPSKVAIEPIKMKVSQFCLVESQTGEQGANYTVLQRWDFSAAAL